MTILFGGGEMGAFVPADSSTNEQTGAGAYDTAFARGCVATLGSSTYADSYEFAGQTDLWVHHEMASAFNFIADDAFVLLNSSGTEVIRLLLTPVSSTTEQYQVQWNNAGTWTNAGSTIDIGKGTLQTIDWHIVIGASGSITLYLSGTQRSTSGTIDLSSLTNVAQVRPRGAANIYHSQVVVTDESTIGWRLKTAAPTGAGATTDWTGTYTEVDELIYSDADFINSATNGQVELLSHSTTVPSGYRVKAVIVTARAKRGSTGPANLQLALRSSGTTYFSSTQALDLGYGAHVAVWETDPATAAAFTASSIAALQFGVKAIT